jgi:multicomponent Na+:H+ antiporter subunit C
MMAYGLCFVLFSLGIYCILRKRNIMKIIIGIVISEYAVNLFFILLGYRMDGRAPIYATDQNIVNLVDPLPQAVVLTSIVIGLATTIFLIGLALRLYEQYGTLDVTKIKELNG